MLTRKTALNVARNFIKDLKKSGYSPLQAYLFGSVLENNIHEYSDIDIAVWDKHFTGILHEDVEKLKYLLLKYKNIELHSFSLKSNENNNPFIKVIKDSGVKIAVK